MRKGKASNILKNTAPLFKVPNLFHPYMYIALLFGVTILFSHVLQFELPLYILGVVACIALVRKKFETAKNKWRDVDSKDNQEV